MRNIFTKHPRAMNETYLEHLLYASVFGTKMLVGGLACIIHAIFPFLFAKTGSNLLFSMVHDYVGRSPHLEPRTESLLQAIEEKRITGKC